MAIKTIDAMGNRKGALEIHKPNVMLCLFSYGGIKGQTAWALQQEMRYFDKVGVNFVLYSVDDDALISRSRSKALSAFHANPNLDVCVMLDHDMEWETGELLALAVKSKMVQSCVSGIYSARAIGKGMSSRPKDERVTMSAMTDQLVEAEYLGGGFLAIPRSVVDEVLTSGKESLELLKGNMKPMLDKGVDYEVLANCALHPHVYAGMAVSYDFFRPICVKRVQEHFKLRPDLPSVAQVPYEYLSEDWAFSWRCTQANPNRPLYLWAFPWLKHYGDYPYTMRTAFVPTEAAPPQGSDEGTRAGEHPDKKVIIP